jgi:peptidoglycan/xylan/chitin deacetylase (PgdA/CDA1 family)
VYRLSVVVTADGDRDVVAPSLRALAGSADAPPFEVVAVLRGREGPGAEASASTPLRVVHAPGAGRAAAHNRAAAAATGELLLFLDRHRQAYPDLLATHDHHHRQGAHVVVGPPDHAAPSPSATVAFEVAHLHNIHFRQTSINREVFQRLGGFDERFDRADAARAGEAELGYRLLRAGYRLRFHQSGHGQRHDAAAVLAQARECGRAAVALVRKHPELAAALLGPGRPGPGRHPLARRGALAGPRLSGLVAAALAPLAVRRAGPAGSGGSGGELLEAVRAVGYWRGVAEAGGVPRSRPLRVLCYHAISDLAGEPVIEPYGVPPARFRGQLDALLGAGYRFIHPDELLAYLDGRAGLPRRPLLLTFDDCYTDLLSTALPELVARGIPAVAFAVSGYVGDSNRWDQAAGAASLPLLDVGGLETLERSGLELGAHSRTHRSLTEVDAAELVGETAGVATDLERAGLPCPRLFAYPHGDHSAEVRQAVRQAGYAAAFTVSPGRVLPSSDRYVLPRVDIRRHHTGWRFRLRVALLGGGRLRRPARELRRRFGRHGLALVPLAAALTSVTSLTDGPGGVLSLAA